MFPKKSVFPTFSETFSKSAMMSLKSRKLPDSSRTRTPIAISFACLSGLLSSDIAEPRAVTAISAFFVPIIIICIAAFALLMSSGAVPIGEYAEITAEPAFANSPKVNAPWSPCLTISSMSCVIWSAVYPNF